MDDASFNAMHGRVSSVETNLEYIRRDLGEVKADLKGVIKRLDTLPTKRDLAADRWQLVSFGLAGTALIVTGIIGGLGWLETRMERAAPPAVAAPQPIIIQVPALPQPPTRR